MSTKMLTVASTVAVVAATMAAAVVRMCIPFFSVPDWPHFSESSDFRGLLQILRNTCRN